MKLPVLGWKEVVKVLKRKGFLFDRQSGSHMIFYHPQSNITVVVPKHNPLKTGTLRAILAAAGISKQDLAELL